jgi:hypothetical protein
MSILTAMIISFLAGGLVSFIGCVIWAKKHKKKIERVLNFFDAQARLDELKELLKEEYGEAKEKVEDVIDDVEDKVDDVKEDVKEVADKIDDKFDEIIDGIKEKVDNIIN